jgi:hypothetical protein
VEISKEVISPGTYWYEDPESGLPKKFSPTSEVVKQMYEDGKAMLAAGLSIPVPLEHQPDAKPLTPSEKAASTLLNNSGWVKDYEMQGDSLFAKLDILDEKAAKKVQNKTVKWTSPTISSFTDGDGKAWDGVISHVALTSRPRFHRQSPFPNIAAAMSFAATLPEYTFHPKALALQGKSFSISPAARIEGSGQTAKPKFPKAFSLLAGIKLAAEDLKKKPKEEAPPKKEGEEKPPEGKEGDKPPGGEEKPHVPNADEVSGGEEDTEGTDLSLEAVLCDLLGILGVQVAEDCDASNFKECLYDAAMEFIRSKHAMSETTETPHGPGSQKGGMMKTNNPVVQEQRPAYLSLEEIEKIADPTLKQLALSLNATQKKNEALEKNAFEEAKRRRQVRMDSITKKLPGSGEKLVALAATMSFSLQDDGTVKDTMTETLDILDAGIAKMQDIPTLLKIQKTELSEAPHPREYQGEITEERRQAIVAELEQHGGRRKVS